MDDLPSPLDISNNQPSQAIAGEGEQALDEEVFDLTTVSASHEFTRAGVPLAPRSVAYDCQHNLLTCIKVPDGRTRRWAVSGKSVEARILELKKAGRLQSKADAGSGGQLPENTGNGRQPHAIAGEERREYDERIREMERDVQIKDRLVNFFERKVEIYDSQRLEFSELLGIYKATLEHNQIDPPKIIFQLGQPTSHTMHKQAHGSSGEGDNSTIERQNFDVE